MSAVEQLHGMILEDGWKIREKLPKAPGGSGGAFSESYLAEKDGRHAFLKAFDFSDAFEHPDTVGKLLQYLASYTHEKEVLSHLGSRRLSNVVLAIGHGQVQVSGYSDMEGRVYYLLFERADSDVRCQMDLKNSENYVWCMQVLRDVCLGLFQVHKEAVAHQDLKPSNVLSYTGKGFKIADFGCSSRIDKPIWHDAAKIPGDKTYYPPELLYGHLHPDFVPRRMGSDMYMLGNLAVFLFSGANMTSLIFGNLDEQHQPLNWKSASGYPGVLAYVQEAFARSLEQLAEILPGIVRSEVLELVRSLCNPDLAKRGYPGTVGTHGQYSLERYLSRLTALVKSVEIKARVQAA